MGKLEGYCLLVLSLLMLPILSSGQLTDIQVVSIKNAQDLKLDCPDDSLQHVITVEDPLTSQVCEPGTLMTRNKLEGHTKRHFEGDEYVQSMQDLFFDIQRLCHLKGDFNIQYMCIPLPRPVAKVINPTHTFETHTQAKYNHTAYLHSSQYTGYPPSVGFECKIKSVRSQEAIVNVYDMHTSNPDAQYPIYAIKNGRDKRYKSQLEMFSFSLNAGELFQVPSLEDHYDLTYFIGITASEGTTLLCVPNLEVLPENITLKNLKENLSNEQEHDTVNGTLSGGGKDSKNLKNSDNNQDPKWRTATTVLSIVVIFVFILLALILVFGVGTDGLSRIASKHGLSRIASKHGLSRIASKLTRKTPSESSTGLIQDTANEAKTKNDPC